MQRSSFQNSECGPSSLESTLSVMSSGLGLAVDLRRIRFEICAA